MRIAVIGAGIVGVSTAYELAADGHELTVFERRGSVAAEASFANAGIGGPGYVTPWSPARRTRDFVGSLRLRTALEPATLGWMGQRWRAGRVERCAATRARMLRLASFSRERLHALTRSLRLDWEHSDGCLVLLRTRRDAAALRPGLDVLRELGIAFDELDAEGCLRVEPGLSRATPLHAGIHLAGDEAGNCRQLAWLMREHAQRLGARFRFHTTVRALHPGARPGVTHEQLGADETMRFGGPGDAASREGLATQPMALGPVTDTFDAVVVCAALGSPQLLAPHGLALPLAAVRGFSITAPLRHIEEHFDFGPRSALIDDRHAVTISRLGKRVRVAGGAQVGAGSARDEARAFATLHKVLNDWFPGAVHIRQAQQWRGARPTLPDGPPLLGASGIDGVWLNLGHGANGFALAWGSARVLADQIGGRAPAIDVEGLGVSRLRD
ncbi:MAG TPA: FAD-dependent oxidoreductase [Burkholderiaceae bacterium]|nr:FAD-dependent oxidoreductase [Burkholderiaceae bacterium]